MPFRLKSVLFDGRTLNLAVKSTRKKTANHFTIIVGKNGVGKSRLLRAITQSFLAFDYDGELPRINRRDVDDESPQGEFRLKYESDGSVVELVTQGRRVTGTHPTLILPHVPKPSTVIATSVSPFDKFPMDKNTPALGQRAQPPEPTLYRYLGSKNQVGQHSSTTLLARVMDSLFTASEKAPPDIHRLSTVFQFLQYQPRIRAEYELLVGSNTLKKLRSSSSEDEVLEVVFNRGSSIVRYYDKHALLKREPNLVPRLREAADHLLIQPIPRRRQYTFDLDFSRGLFRQGSLRMYEDMALFRRYRLARLGDFRLFKDNSLSISVSDASSGEQCVVLILLGIASEISNNGLICIDEPEISLHPEWQEKFIELLTETFSNYSGCHFLLATHSPQILSRIEGAEASVLTMDDGVLHSATEFSGKSSDYQLVEAFRAPGLRNEFLTRIGLAVLTKLSTTGQVDATYRENYNVLLKARPMLEDDDPVAKLIDGIVSAEKGV